MQHNAPLFDGLKRPAHEAPAAPRAQDAATPKSGASAWRRVGPRSSRMRHDQTAGTWLQPSQSFIVLASITVLTLTIGFGLYLEGGVPDQIAAAAALGLYVLLLSIHALVSYALEPSFEAGAASALVRRAATARSEPQAPVGGAPTDAGGLSQSEPSEPPRSVHKDLAGTAPAGPLDLGAAPQTRARPTPPPLPGVASATPGWTLKSQSAPAPVHAPASTSGPRPLPPKLPHPPMQPAAKTAEATAAITAQDLHGMVKRMADGVTAQETNRAQAGRAPDEVATDLAVAALRETAGAMRKPSTANARTTASPAALASSLDAIAAALEAERVDVFLEPIMGLSDQRAKLYEMSVRVRLDDGTVVASEQLTALARRTGLLPWFDDVRIERASRIAQRMRQLGKPASLMSPLSGESLSNDQLLSSLSRRLKPEPSSPQAPLVHQLILAFSQEDARDFTQSQLAALTYLHGLGLRFALEDVVDLDMDFAALRATGFAYVKLDAQVLLEGMPGADGVVSPRDLCRHLAGLGLTLIVGHIADEHQLALIMGFGVVLGQGTLFGAPRPVRADVAEGGATAAA